MGVDMFDSYGDSLQSYYDAPFESYGGYEYNAHSTGSSSISADSAGPYSPAHGLDHAVDSSRWTAATSYLNYDPTAMYLPQPSQQQQLWNPDSPKTIAHPAQALSAPSGTATIGQVVGSLADTSLPKLPSAGALLYTPPPTAGVPSPPQRLLPSLSFDDDDMGSTPKIKPFISKLVHLVDTPAEYRDCIVWDESGTSFIICHASARLLQEVLPKYFGHSNIHSFTRQLNVYGFSRMSQVDLADKLATSTTSDYSGWSHPLFVRDDKSMLQSLTPKPSKARMQKKVEKQERLAREEAQRRQQHLAKAHAHTQANLAQIGLTASGATGAAGGAFGVSPLGTYFDYRGGRAHAQTQG